MYTNYGIQNKSEKERSIIQLQAIYLKTKNRHLRKNKFYLKNVYDRIINEIPTEKGEKVILNKQNDLLNKITYTLFYEYGKWGYNKKILKLDTREERLFYLSDPLLDLRFELGNLHNQNIGSDKHFHNFIWEKLVNKITNRLQDKYKGKKCNKAFTLKIGDVQYIVTCDDPNNLYYKKFQLIETNNNIIEL